MLQSNKWKLLLKKTVALLLVLVLIWGIAAGPGVKADSISTVLHIDMPITVSTPSGPISAGKVIMDVSDTATPKTSGTGWTHELVMDLDWPDVLPTSGITSAKFTFGCDNSSYMGGPMVIGGTTHYEATVGAWTQVMNRRTMYDKINVYMDSDNFYTVEFLQKDGTSISMTSVNQVDNGVCTWQPITPPASADGTSFIGWSTSPTSYVPAGTSAPTSSFTNHNLKLYAFYGDVATVTFDKNGGTGDGPDVIKYSNYGNVQFPGPNQLTKAGYTFKGWGDDVDSYSTGGTVYQEGNALTLPNTDNDKTFYAQWAKNYTVTYDLNGSTAAPPQSSTAVAGPDGTVDITAAPSNGITRPGYTFEGWSTNQNSTTADIAPGSTHNISGDTTLYAVWNQNDYNISFDLNGAVNNPAPVLSSVTGHHGDTITLPNPALVKDHYKFKGWYETNNGTETVYSPGGSLTIGDATPQNLTLHAKWEDAEKYTLAFDMGGNDVDGSLPSGGTYYNDSLNDTVTLPASSLTRIGYTFAGWTKTKGSSTVDYADQAVFQITEDTTLYPVWTEGTFTLDYDFNGEGDALHGSVPGSVQGGPDSGIAAALQGNMRRSEYRFTGWNTAANGTGTTYLPGIPILLNHNITLYAQWEALDPVFITYDTNCSDPLVQAPVDTTEYFADGVNEEGKVTSVVLNRFGYNFKGWNTKNDGTGTSYAAGADITVKEDTELFAVWEEGTYTLTYDRNASTATGELPDDVTGKLASTISAGSADKLKLAHHHFKEWNTSSDGSGVGYQPGHTISLGADTTLYAIWEKNNYEVTYDLNANDAQGTVPSKDSGTYDETFAAPSLNGISRPKYRPIGWNDDPDGNGKDYTPGTSYHFDDTKTLYVKWEAVPPYEVHYFKNANDAVGTPPEDNNTYCKDGITPTSVTVLDKNDLKRPGYEFAGWNTKQDGTGQTYQPGDSFIITTHMNFYAQWKVGTYTLTFDKGHSSVTGSGPAAVTSRSDKYITLPAEGGFKRKDFGFTGWNTKDDGSGSFYKAGSKLKILEDTTLYAQWKRLVNLSFDNSEGALKGDTSLQVTEGTKLGDVKLPSVNAGYTVKEWIINGEKVNDYKNYIVDKDSDVVLVLEKTKDPAPKPTPGDGTKPSKPDKDNPNGGNGSGNGGGNGSNGGSGNGSSGNGSGGSGNGSGGSGNGSGGSGNGSGGNSGGNSSSGSGSGSNSQGGSLSGGTSGIGSTINNAGSGQSGSTGGSRSFEAGKPTSRDTDTASQNNTDSNTLSTGELTTIQEEQVPLSSGNGIFSKSHKSGSAYGSIWECIIHWMILLGMLLNMLYGFLRSRHIRKERLLGAGFFLDTFLPMLAIPLCVLAFEFRKCALDIYFILAWALLAMGVFYHINRQFQRNAEEVEQELAQ